MKPHTLLATFLRSFLKFSIPATLNYLFKHFTAWRLCYVYMIEQDILDSRVIWVLLVLNVLLTLFTLIHMSYPSLFTGSLQLHWACRASEFIYWSCIYILLSHWLQLWYFSLIVTILSTFCLPLFLCYLGSVLIAWLLRYVGTAERVVVRFETVTFVLFQVPLMLLFVLSCSVTMPVMVRPDVLAVLLVFQ